MMGIYEDSDVEGAWSYLANEHQKWMDRAAALEAALRITVDALDDAIKHNVNATEHDSAGWTQEDYDDWAAARERGESLLRPAVTSQPPSNG